MPASFLDISKCGNFSLAILLLVMMLRYIADC